MDKQTKSNILKTVKDNYNSIADHYSETRKKHLWTSLIYLTGKAKDGDRVLDVGCGSGKLLAAFKDKKIEYLGIDPCKKLLQNAKEQFPAYNFTEGDIMDLGGVSQLDYDFVFCIAVLQHIPTRQDQIKALRQLKNKVKKDGRIIVSVWDMWSSEKYRSLIFRFALLKLIGKNKMNFADILFDWKDNKGRIKGKRYYHAFNRLELIWIFKKAGLKIEKIYKDNHNFYAILKK